MQIIIIGASGLIGRNLYNYCKENAIKVYGTYYRNKTEREFLQFDMRVDSYKKLVNVFPESDNAYVVICGANSSIDSCFRNEKESSGLNIDSTKKIADEIHAMGHKIIFLSSEAVFDGKKGLYTEVDIPMPSTLYGKQKREMERYLLDRYPDSIVLRISRACGSSFGEKDIFNDFYSKIINMQEIICLKNQSFSLTHVNDIAKAIIGTISYNLAGLYHIASNNYISRYDLACIYSKYIFGGYKYIYEKEYNEIPFLDNRPVWLGLNGNKLVEKIEIKYMSLYDMLERYKVSCQKQINNKNEQIIDL